MGFESWVKLGSHWWSVIRGVVFGASYLPSSTVTAAVVVSIMLSEESACTGWLASGFCSWVGDAGLQEKPVTSKSRNRKHVFMDPKIDKRKEFGALYP